MAEMYSLMSLEVGVSDLGISVVWFPLKLPFPTVEGLLLLGLSSVQMYTCVPISVPCVTTTLVAHVNSFCPHAMLVGLVSRLSHM